jgi:hypothetical protein
MKQAIVFLLFVLFGFSCMDNPVVSPVKNKNTGPTLTFGVYLAPEVMGYYSAGFKKTNSSNPSFVPYRVGAETFLRLSSPEGVNIFGRDFPLGHWPQLENAGDIKIPVSQGLGDMIVNLVVDGFCTIVPMGLIINGTDSVMLKFADYYPGNTPNGTAGWRIRLEKYNNDQLVLFQGFSGSPNTEKVWQAVIFVTDTTSYMNEYPDIVAFLPRISAGFPPAFSSNESDVAISGGVNYLNPVKMFTAEFDIFGGRLVGYYSFYSFEENPDFSDFVRIFMSEEPTEPIVGMWIGEVKSGQILPGSLRELDKVFVRHQGGLNQETVLAYGRYGNRGVSVVDFLGLGNQVQCDTLWEGDKYVKLSQPSVKIGDFDISGADSVLALLEYSPLGTLGQDEEKCYFRIVSGVDTLRSGIIPDQGEGQHWIRIFSSVPSNAGDWELKMFYAGPNVGPNSTHIRKLVRCN